MRAGDLCRRITIRLPAETADAIGEPAGEPAGIATVWAAYQPATGRQIQSSGRDVAQAVDVFRVRYRGDLNESMTVEFGGNTYQIERIAEIGRREGLELTCRRIR